MKRPKGPYCRICAAVLKRPIAGNLLKQLDYPLCIHKDDPCEVRE